MAIEIKNFKSNVGLNIKTAYLIVTNISYDTRIKALNFLASIFTDEEGDIPVERDVINGYIEDIDLDGDLENNIYKAINAKIEAVKDKTEIECYEHNIGVSKWEDVWEYYYNRFISDESSEDEDNDDYIEAAKILLGE